MKEVLLLASIFLLTVIDPALAEKSQRGVTVGPSGPGNIQITGDYWALLIGIDKYKHVEKLESAVRDAKAIGDSLVRRYGFRPERVMMLLDEQATREGIENALYRLGQDAGPNDSVFVYYAGHGQIDDANQRGYWVPVEGRAQSPGTFISNARIRDDIAAMKARHVFLVADSCFSGSLFGRSRSLPPITNKFIATLYKNKSRWALTSGMNQPVTDQGKNGHSIFAYFFLKVLQDNENPYLIPSQIYDRIAPLVANNSEQQPRSQPLHMAGDEGGQFVFRTSQPAVGSIKPQPALAPLQELASAPSRPLGSPEKIQREKPTASRLQSEPNLSREREAQQSQTTRNEFLRERREAEKKLTAEREALEKEQRDLDRYLAQARARHEAEVMKVAPPLTTEEAEAQRPIVEARLRSYSTPPSSLSTGSPGKFASDSSKWQRFSLGNLEREWQRVKEYAQAAGQDARWRLAAVKQFKTMFPENNPYASEADKLIRGLEQEVAGQGRRTQQLPTAMQDTGRQAGVLSMRTPEALLAACGNGRGGACQELGWQYELEGDDGRAASLYRQGCTELDPAACFSLGSLSLAGGGKTGDLEQATNVLRRACEDGNRQACGNLKALEALKEKGG